MTGRSNLARVITIIIGIVTLAVGYYAYFTSSWVELEWAPGAKFYKICEFAKLNPDNPNCPNIALEHIFIGVVPTCLFISVLGLVFVCVVNGNRWLDILDVSLQIASAIALIVGGSLFIVSAQQIHNLFGGDGNEEENLLTSFFLPLQLPKDLVAPRQDIGTPSGVHFRRTEKFVAGSLAILNGIFYMAACGLKEKFRIID